MPTPFRTHDCNIDCACLSVPALRNKQPFLRDPCQCPRRLPMLHPGGAGDRVMDRMDGTAVYFADTGMKVACDTIAWAISGPPARACSVMQGEPTNLGREIEVPFSNVCWSGHLVFVECTSAPPFFPGHQRSVFGRWFHIVFYSPE